MYDPKSLKAEEFIDDDEIQATIRYARENRNNRELVDAILEKAKACKKRCPQFFPRARNAE